MIPVLIGLAAVVGFKVIESKFGDALGLTEKNEKYKKQIEEKRYQRRVFLQSAQGQDLLRRAWEEYQYQLNNGNDKIEKDITQSDMEDMYIRYGKISFKR